MFQKHSGFGRKRDLADVPHDRSSPASKNAPSVHRTRQESVAAAPLADAPRADPQQVSQRSDADTQLFKSLKQQFFSALVDQIDLPALSKLEPGQARVEIGAILTEIIDERQLGVASADKARIVADIATQVLGYLPSSDLDYSGDFSGTYGCTQIVTRRVTFTGNSSLNVDCSAAGTRRIPVGEIIALVE